MGNQMRYLSKPITDCEYAQGLGTTLSYTAASMQGWRKYQEDRFICVPDFLEDYSFFGVYDGHGGSEIAEFLRRRLHLEIKHFLQKQDDIELALQLGFLACDASIMVPENIAELNEIVEEEHQGGGTALQILKNPKSLEAAMSQTGEDQSPGPSAKPTFTENLFNAGSSAGAVMQQIFQNIAGPSQEKKKPEEDSEEMMEVERPLHYLLSDDIEPSDPEDEDYNIDEDEESSSTESEEETNCFSTEEFLNSEPGYLSGSTATVAIVGKNRIYVANVGDSRCVLSRKGQAIDMSLDHKPDDPEEQARIIGAGGSVSEDGRVDNCLNLSRAFGDFKFKGGSLVPSEQCITAEPFIKSIDIEKGDDFLIIASDGIWNSMSSQEVVDYITVRLKAEGSKLREIVEEMFTFTLASDKDNDGTGCDNMCCIIIKLGTKKEVYTAFTGNKVTCVEDSEMEEPKNASAPTSGSAEQMATEKNSAGEKNCQHSNLTVQCPLQSIQHLVNSHWLDFSLLDKLTTKEISLDFSQNVILNLACNEFHSSAFPVLKDMSFYVKDQDLVKFANLGVIDSADSYYKNTQLKGNENWSDSDCNICLPISSEQFLCNKYTSNIFKNLGHLITV